MIHRGLDLSKVNLGGDAFMIAGIPLPPSDNHQYISVINRLKNGKMIAKRTPSKGFIKYKKAFHDWALVNMTQLTEARFTVKAWKCPMELQLYFCMSLNKLQTVEGVLKIIDANNRDKALQDLLAAALFINDTQFSVTRCEKVITSEGNDQVLAVFKPQKLRTVIDVMGSLTDERIL